MSRTPALAPTRRPIGLFLTLLLLASFGCSDGGSGGRGSGGGSAVGSASIFLTDAPSDYFDEILVSIRAIDLLCRKGTVNVFRGQETVDLKDLENFSDLFVHASEIPVGVCNKIRLRIDSVELIDGDEVIPVDPPANGKIDLLPRGEFEIREGVNLVIEIDMDAKKSIHVIGTGQHRYKFRPVIFVRIRETLPPPKLARVQGVIAEIVDATHFELCTTRFVASRSDSSEERGLGYPARCMLVELDAETGLFDSNGDPVEADALSEEDEVTIVGIFHMVDRNHDDMMDEQSAGPSRVASFPSHWDHRSALEAYIERLRERRDDGFESYRDEDEDEKDDYEDDDRPRPPREAIVFLAYTVEIGPPGTFLHLRGVIDSALDDQDEFEFALAPKQGFGEGSVVTALLQEGTRIFSKHGVEVGPEEIIPETRAKIDGVFASDALGTFYKTALLVLDLALEPTGVLRGEVVSADAETQELEFAVNGSDECVSVPDETRIYLISQIGGSATSEEGDFSDLLPGLRADVFGAFEEVGSCFVARTIIGFRTPCDDSDSCPTDQFCLREPGTCSAAGTCERRPQECITIFEPVCGCDGQTYSNVCVAARNGVSIESEGSCPLTPAL